jgi:hypothetical protein
VNVAHERKDGKAPLLSAAFPGIATKNVQMEVESSIDKVGVFSANLLANES